MVRAPFLFFLLDNAHLKTNNYAKDSCFVPKKNPENNEVS